MVFSLSSYILTSCSPADISKDHFQRLNIPYVSFHYELGGTTRPDDLWTTMSPRDFYQAMLDGAETHTSQVNVMEYINFWRPFLEQGKDVLHVTLSSGISGTYNSAMTAAEAVMHDYPERKVRVVDSMAASSGFGLLLDTMAEKRDAGASLEELAQFAEEHRLYLHHWFFSSDLTFYIRGGRVTKTAGFFGKLLNICPMLNVNNQGRLIPREKIRTKKKAIIAIVEHMKEHAEGGLNYSQKVFLSHSDALEDAQQVAALVEASFPRMKGKVEINNIGSTIGAHTGPGTIALFFWGDLRTE